jgi:hypothetical protein
MLRTEGLAGFSCAQQEKRCRDETENPHDGCAELVRLVRDCVSDREIAGLVGLNHRTISRYRRWAANQHLLDAPLPIVGELHDQLQATLPVRLPPQCGGLPG